MLTEETRIDKIEILEDGQIQVREATIVFRDGVEIGRSKHRYVLDPSRDEITDPRLGKPGIDVRAIAQTMWTQDVVDARKDFLEAQKDKVDEIPTPEAEAQPPSIG